MAVNQLKTKFIGNDQVDSSKLLIEQGAALRAKDNAGVTQELLKFGASNEVLANGAEIAYKSVTDSLQTDLDAVELRMDAAELDIDNLQTDLAALDLRVDTAESDIDALELRMTTAEGEIDTLQLDLDAAELRLDAAELDIDQLQIDVGNLESSKVDRSGDLGLSGQHQWSTVVAPGETLYTTVESGSLEAKFLQGSDQFIANISSTSMNMESVVGIVLKQSVIEPSVISLVDDGIAAIPTLEQHVTTKKYVDDEVAVVQGEVDAAELRLDAVESDIVDLQNEDLTFLKLDGSRPMTANLNMMNGLVHNKIVGLADPTDARDAVNKQYVDAIAEGLHVHAPAKVIATASLASITGGSVTYANGVSGVGATLTLGVALTSLDTYSFLNGDRIIIAGESNQAHNGIYVWATGGTVLTRATDADSVEAMAGGDFIFVQEGATYGNTGWVQTETATSIGTSPIVFQQFSGAGSYTAGDALMLDGSEFNVKYDDSSIGVNGSNQLFIKNSGVDTLQLANDSVDKDKIAADVAGLGLGQNVDGSLEVNVDDSTIEINADALRVKADGITKNEINADVAGIGLQQNVDGSLEIKLDGSSLAVGASGLKSNIGWGSAVYEVSSTLTTGAFFDFADVAEVGSIIAHVDRLAIHEGALWDFTVSYTGGVGGKTRITFVNALVTPGQQQLSNGDNVFFKFQKKLA